MHNRQYQEQLSLNYEWGKSKIKGFSLILPYHQDWTINSFDLTTATLLSSLVYVGLKGEEIIPKIKSERRQDLEMLSQIINEKKVKCNQIYRFYRESDIKGFFDFLLKEEVLAPDSWPKEIYLFRTMQVSAVLDMLAMGMMQLGEAEQWWKVFKSIKHPNAPEELQVYKDKWEQRLSSHFGNRA